MDKKQREGLEKSILDEADRLLDAKVGYAEFTSRVFGEEGLLRRLWTTEAERKTVVGSPLYRRLQANASRLRRAEARAFDDEVEEPSGRLTVVVPKSLHAALRSEAAREGVSLSELIRMKLGVPYREIVRLMLNGVAQERAA